jgi:hypothetical protein
LLGRCCSAMESNFCDFQNKIRNEVGECFVGLNFFDNLFASAWRFPRADSDFPYTENDSFCLSVSETYSEFRTVTNELHSLSAGLPSARVDTLEAVMNNRSDDCPSARQAD